MNMNPRTRIFTRKSAMPIILLMSLLIFVPFTITSAEVTELNVTPEVVVQGETLSISGKASLPDEEVWIGSSFAISLPVSDGEYYREFIGIYFPEGEKEFSVTAENVKNIRISLKTEEGTVESPPLNAINGTATISISFPISTPFGPVDVSVYGDAVEDATSVNLKVATSIKVPANSNGDFTLDISTGGMPIGEFLITAGGLEKTVHIVSAEPSVFDTGSSENPYPSIFGMHNGTIIPNQPITVNRLYTYPCSGTGGHSEYIRIWNNSGWNRTATWEGYDGDWHNLSFPNSFTLVAGETYNYTIRTGSYPQIHHTDNLEVASGTGKITCDKFVDANGKEYNDWIPAIKLLIGEHL